VAIFKHAKKRALSLSVLALKFMPISTYFSERQFWQACDTLGFATRKF
jgi:hypothetical protein